MLPPPTHGARGARFLRVLSAPPLALALGMLLTAILGLYWIELEHAVGRQVDAGLIEPVSDALQLQHAGNWDRLIRTSVPGLLVWPPLLLWRLGATDHRVLLWTVLLFMLGCQAVLYDIGRLLRGPWTGVLAAIFFPLVPEIAMMAHRWAPFLPEAFFLLLAFDLLLRSRSLTRPLPTLGFLMAAWVALNWSTMSTHNTPVLACVGAMALGAALRGLLLARGPLAGEQTSRWRCLALGLLSATALIWALRENGLFAAHYLHYVRDEVASRRFERHVPWWSWRALTAYPRFWFWASLSPVFSLPLLVALPAWLRRGQGRAELIAWLVLPVAAFSLLAKKNPYYVFLSLPAAVLVLAAGLTELSRWRLGLVLAISTLSVGSLQWAKRSTQRRLGPRLGLDVVRLPMDVGLVMETVLPPLFEPTSAFEHKRPTDLLVAAAHRSPCDSVVRPRVVVLFPDDYQDMRLMVALKDPCVGNVRAWPVQEELSEARWILVADPVCQPGPDLGAMPVLPAELPWAATAAEVAATPSVRLVAQDRSASPCWYLLHNRWPQGPR